MLRKQSGMAIVALALMLSAGCVEREMLITSDPEGVKVTVNQTWVGKTPFKMKFMHYGVYDIRLEQPGYYPMQVKEPVKAPAYQQPGLDLVSEALVPAKLKDFRELHYKMEKIEKEDDINDIMARNDEVKEKARLIAAQREEKDKNRKPLHLPLSTKKETAEKEKDRRKAEENVQKKTEPENETQSAQPQPETTPTPAPELDG